MYGHFQRLRCTRFFEFLLRFQLPGMFAVRAQNALCLGDPGFPTFTADETVIILPVYGLRIFGIRSTATPL